MKTIITLAAALFCCINTHAAMITSLATGNWDAPATWVGGVVPGSADSVTIVNSHAVTVNIDTSCAFINIISTGSLTRLLVATGITFTVSGNIVIDGNALGVARIQLSGNGSILNAESDIVMNGISAAPNQCMILMNVAASVLNIKGNFLVTNDATLTTSVNIESTVNFNGSVSQTVFLPNFIYANITIINSSDTVTLGAAVTDANVIGNITINSGAVLSNGGFAMDELNGDTLMIRPLGVLLLTAASSFPTGFKDSIMTGSVVHYSGTDQTVFDTTYSNLVISGTGTKTAGGNISVTDSLSVTASLFQIAANTLSGAGKLNMTGGELQIAKLAVTVPELAGTYTISAGKIVLNGAGDQTIRSATYNKLETAGGTGNKTLGGATTVSDSMIIGVGTTLDVTASAFSMTVSGNWDNNGTFLPDLGVVTFSGANQAIKSGGSSFYDVIFSGGGGDTLKDIADIDNILSIAAGNTLDADGNNITVGANWTNAGGTFLHGGNTVTFDGVTQDITSGGSSFNHVVFSGGGTDRFMDIADINGGLTIEFGSTLNANTFDITTAGDFTNNGTFTPGTLVTFDGTFQNITSGGASFTNVAFGGATGTQTLMTDMDVNGGLTINVDKTLNSNNRGINIAGNWTNSGTFTAGSDTVIFDGAGIQTLINTAGERFSHFRKTGAGTLDANDNIQIDSTLVMSSGNINMNAGGSNDTITLGTSTANEGVLSRNAGTVIGRIRKWVNTTGIDYNFPVGTAANHRPAIINFAVPMIGGSLVVEFVASDPGNTGLPVAEPASTDSIYDTFSDGYWAINPMNGLSSTDYDLDLVGTGFTEHTVHTDSTHVLKRPAGSWIINGIHSAASADTAKRETLSGFSDFALGNICAGPATITIAGDDTVCTSTTGQIYTAGGPPQSSYQWIITGGAQTGGGSSNSITVDWGSTGRNDARIQVIETNYCGAVGDTVSRTIVLHTIPTATITGPVSVMEGDSYNYAVTDSSFAGYTYTWAVDSGVINDGNTTPSINVTWNDAIGGSPKVRVIADSGSCASAPEDTLNVTITCSAMTPLNATGNDTVCTSSISEPYTVISYPGSKYLWTITGGVQSPEDSTNSITIDWGSTGRNDARIIVREVDFCSDTGVADTQIVVLHTIPTATITGPVSVIGGDSYNYAVTDSSFAGYTYTWAADSGVINAGNTTPSINVTWDDASGGSPKVRVIADSGSCASAPEDTLNVAIDCAAMTPLSITGNDTVCTSSIGEAYTVISYSGSKYLWTITGGVQSPEDSVNITTVNWGSTGRNDARVIVREVNFCSDTGVADTQIVVLHTIPTATITGPVSVVGGASYNYAVTDSSFAGYTYTWAADSGVINAGNTTPSINVTWNNANGGSPKVRVTADSGSCASAPADTLNVTIGSFIISAASGNWNVGATWVGGVAPTSDDSVRISENHTVTVTSTTDSCKSVVVKSGFDETFLLISVNNRLNVVNYVTIQGDAGFFTRGVIGLDTGATLFVGSDLHFNGNSDPSLTTMWFDLNSTLLINGSIILTALAETRRNAINTSPLGTVEFGGTSTQTFAMGSNVKFNNLRINNQTDTVKPTSAITATNILANIYVEGAAGKLSSNNMAISRAAGDTIFIVTGGGEIILTGTSAWRTSGGKDSVATGSTIKYAGGVQTVNPLILSDFSDLVIAGSDTAKLGADIVLRNDLIINSGSILQATSNRSITLQGNWTNNGTFDAENGEIVFNSTTAGQTIGGTSKTTLYDLTIDASGQTVNAATSQEITGSLNPVAGTFSIDAGDTLIIVSNANGTGRVDSIRAGASVGGLFRIQRYITGSTNHYKLLGSPATGRTIADWDDNIYTQGFTGANTTLGTANIISYDETVLNVNDSGFVYATNTTNPLNDGEGYFVRLVGSALPLTIDVTGSLNTGTFTWPASIVSNTVGGAGSDHDGWCLVSNPFASTIDWDPADASCWSRLDVKSIYYKKIESGAYVSYNHATDLGDATKTIPSTQAFWIQTDPAYVDGTFSVGERCKTSTDEAFLKTQNPLEHLILTLSGNGYNDKCYIAFVPGTTDSINSIDGGKFINPSPSPNISTIAYSTDLTHNSLPEFTSDMSIPLKALVYSNGNYTISVTGFAFMQHSACILLEDKLLSTFTDLKKTPSYSFYAYNTTDTARFVLHLGAPIQQTGFNASCSGANDGMIVAQGQGPGPWTYNWYDLIDPNRPKIRSVSNVASADTLRDISAGKYLVITIGGNGICGDAADTISITEPSDINYDFTTANVNCNGDADGRIDLVVTGGTPPYTYNWLPGGATTEDIIDLQAGIYTFDITDNINCKTTGAITISEPSAIMLDITADADTLYIDQGATVKLINNSTGAVSYSWVFGDGSPVSSADTVSHTFSSIGIYYIVLNGKNSNPGCPDAWTSKMITVLNSLDVAEQFNDQKYQINIFNTGNNIVAEFRFAEMTKTNISVVNLLGQTVTDDMTVNVKNDKIYVNVPKVRGVYFVNIKTDEMNYTQKVVK